MTMDPSTGAGFDAVPVGTQDYFDPNATDDNYPGVTGLMIHKTTYWQGDVQFDTFDTIGPSDQSTYVSPDGGPADPSGNPFGDPGNQPHPGLPAGSYIAPDGQTIIVPEGSRASACISEIGYSEQAIVIELHGAFGFPDGVCKFPITPEGPGPDFPSNSHWYPDVVGMGEIVIPGYEKLESIGWQSFWPNQDGYDDYCCVAYDELVAMGDPHDAAGPIANLIWTKRFSLVCRLVVGGSLFNDDVVITDFGYSDNFGDPNSVSYKITFKRYRTSQIQMVANPDADLDQYSDVGQVGTQVSPQQGSSGDVSPSDNTTAQPDPAGDGTNPQQITPDSPLPTSFSTPGTGGVNPVAPPAPTIVDEGTARKEIALGTNARPTIAVTVLPISDSRVVGGGSIFQAFSFNTGETINQVCAREGVTWDTNQKFLNPDLMLKDPNTYNLPVGSTINLQLSGSADPSMNQTPSISPDAPPTLDFGGNTGQTPTRHAVH